MVPCSNWLHLENKRYNRIDKRGTETNFNFTNKIDKININFEAPLPPPLQSFNILQSGQAPREKATEYFSGAFLLLS